MALILFSINLSNHFFISSLSQTHVLYTNDITFFGKDMHLVYCTISNE
jgi:hypothetical protein